MKTLSNYINEQYINEKYYFKKKQSRAEIMEYVVCFAHNKIFMEDDEKNLNYILNETSDVNNHALRNTIKSIYYKNTMTYDKMAMPLNFIRGGLKKLADNSDDLTSEFKKNSGYGNFGSRVPKTDIYGVDKKSGKEYKISVKKYDGSEFCSASIKETKGILLNFIDMLNEEDRKKLELLLSAENWYGKNIENYTITDVKKDKNNKYYQEIIAADIKNNEVDKALKEILYRNPEFTNAVIREAALGEKKFGTNAKSCANYFYLWDETNPSNSYAEDAEKFLPKYYMNVNVTDDDSDKNGATFNVCWKTSVSHFIYTALRISIK